MADWQEHAECRNHPPELFFPKSRTETAPAIRICHTCPVFWDCHAEVRRVTRPYGVWAGEYWNDGRTYVRNRTPNKPPGTPAVKLAELAARRREALELLERTEHEYESPMHARRAVAERYGVCMGTVRMWQRDAERRAQAA